MESPVTPAPGRLELVRAFVNTRDIDLGTDEFETPPQLRAWLRDKSLLRGAVTATPADLGRAVQLREALREALLANHEGQRLPRAALTSLNEASMRADTGLEFSADAGSLARPRAKGIDGAIGELVVVIADAMRDGTWRRLKACVNDTCQWAFYDESRARSGKWCSMQICGNRAKQQAWRARHD